MTFFFGFVCETQTIPLGCGVGSGELEEDRAFAAGSRWATSLSSQWSAEFLW